jgi:uncharacterized protein YjbJ (UPF0337 family)
MADTTRKGGDENRVEGTAKELGGKVRGGVGDMLDDRDEHWKGKTDELEGKVQKNFGKMERKIDEKLHDQ